MANTRGKRKEMEPVDEVMEAVETTESKTETVEKFTPKNGTVKCAALHVRKEPSTSATSLKIISRGTTVKVLSEASDEWYKVRVDGAGTGYCMKEFIELGK